MKPKLTAAALVAALSGAAHAALPPFETLDQDKDGAISQEEANASQELVAMFAEADVDKDGKLSPAEYEAVK